MLIMFSKPISAKLARSMLDLILFGHTTLKSYWNSKTCHPVWLKPGSSYFVRGLNQKISAFETPNHTRMINFMGLLPIKAPCIKCHTVRRSGISRPMQQLSKVDRPAIWTDNRGSTGFSTGYRTGVQKTAKGFHLEHRVDITPRFSPCGCPCLFRSVSHQSQPGFLLVRLGLCFGGNIRQTHLSLMYLLTRVPLPSRHQAKDHQQHE
jgi:hypothetical protein